MSYATRKRKVERRKRQAAIKHNQRSEKAGWRSEPATERQLKVLKRIRTETGEEFPADVTRGQASDAITRRFEENEFVAARARRARRARRKAAA